jgi:hypothetical protein
MGHVRYWEVARKVRTLIGFNCVLSLDTLAGVVCSENRITHPVIHRNLGASRTQSSHFTVKTTTVPRHVCTFYPRT